MFRVRVRAERAAEGGTRTKPYVREGESANAGAKEQPVHFVLIKDSSVHDMPGIT